MKKLTILAAATVLIAGCKNDTGNGASAANNAPITPVTAPNGGDWTQMIRQTPEGGMMMGNPDAPVKVVEFSSMTCPHCAHFSENGQAPLVQNYVKTGQVSFEFRNFVRDPLDITMALIARCAGATPQFFTITDALFKNQAATFERLQAAPQPELQALASLPPAQQFGRYAQFAGLQEFAAQRGLPSAKTGQCLANQQETEKLVQMNTDAVTNYQLQGTPTFLINNNVVDMPGVGEADVWKTLEQRIRDELS